jgi:uncharacterized membrane protein
MEHLYDEEKEVKFYKSLFWIFQISTLLIVGGFLYSGFVAISSLIAKRGLSIMAYTPEVVLSALYLWGAYRGVLRFESGRRLSSVGLVLGVASLVIVLLWVHLSKMV